MSQLIGLSLPRPDAVGKVTGSAAYAADLIHPGMLHLQVVFAHRPHARIRAIHTSAAQHHPGVVAVLTAADVPDNRIGLIVPDQPVLCADVVRFVGDKVALVVAESKEAAIAGSQLVAVEYEDLPAVTDAHTALTTDAPLVHAHRNSNVLLHVPIRKGNSEQAFAEADVVLEDTFTTSWQEHAFLQPEAGIAYIDEQERLVVETGGQWMHDDRRQIAHMLQLPEDQVIIRYAAIGGAFGGKEDLSVQHLLALATWKLRRPTAIVWSREESIIGHCKRHPLHIHCRWAAKRNGDITAAEVELLADGGAYASTSMPLIKVATLAATGCYEIPHISLNGYVVYTNNIPAGAFRGFGATQAQFACEVMVTRLAHALGIDPAELRRRNIYREGSIEPTQSSVPVGVGALPVLERCIEEARTRLNYGQPRQQNASHLRRGVGITCSIKNVGYAFGFPEQATATIELFGKADLEHANIRIGVSDIGQGSHLALRQIAAETLGLALEQVTMICTDTQETPDAGSTSASRLTLIAGQAVREAALEAKRKWEFTDDDHITVTRQHHPPTTTALDPVTGKGNPNFCYGYSAQALEVEVNMLTGRVQVLRVISVHDVGKAINLQLVEGQIEGAIAQALGYALLENFQVHDGQILTKHFSTYLLPTIVDVPTEIVCIPLEIADPNGPFGARGIGEMAFVPLLPAIASAIHDATGLWLKQQPITAERVFMAIHGNK